jgi:hypothetical protein
MEMRQCWKNGLENMYTCTAFIQAKPAKIAAIGGNPHNKCIKIMMTNAETINIVETAMKTSNRQHLEAESVCEAFRKVDQDPSKDCIAEFTAHLDKLKKDYM